MHSCKDTSKEVVTIISSGRILVDNSVVICVDIIDNLSTTYIFVIQKKANFTLEKNLHSLIMKLFLEI